MVTWYLWPMELMHLVNQQYIGLRLTQMLVFQKIQVRHQKSQQLLKNQRLQHHQRLHWKFFQQYQQNQLRQQPLRHQQNLTIQLLQLMLRSQKLQQSLRLQRHQLRQLLKFQRSQANQKNLKRQHHR